MALTLENSGAALVAGRPLPRTTRRVRVLRPFMVDGARAAAGAELTLPAAFANEMCAANKAEHLAEPEATAASTAATQPPAPKPQKRKDSGAGQ